MVDQSGAKLSSKDLAGKRYLLWFFKANTIGFNRSFDDATVHELNVSRNAGLKDYPRARTGCGSTPTP